MRYSGIQPHYFPRLHYFARVLSTDIFMLRDDVQFVPDHKYPDGRTDKSYQAHTPVKIPSGRFLMPVSIIHGGLAPISQKKIAYANDWIDKHFRHLVAGYKNAPYYDRVYPQIKALLNKRYQTLAELDITTCIWGIFRILGDDSPDPSSLTLPSLNKKLRNQSLVRLKEVRRASESEFIKHHAQTSTANEKIIGLITEIGADEDYCGGTAHQAYMDEGLYKKHGITITIQDWTCREYPQQFTKHHGFIPNLSIIDLFMNVPVSEIPAYFSSP